MAETDDRFLSRWSRRKREETRQDTKAEDRRPEQVAAVPVTPQGAAPEVARDPDAGDPEVVARLPDIDSLDESSDFSAFLQEGVPEALKRQALRKLWRLNPALANLDGLNDYDEDFTIIQILGEQVKTLYQAGKGYLDETAEPEGEAEPDGGEGAPAGAESQQATTDVPDPGAAEAEDTTDTDADRPVAVDAPADSIAGSVAEGSAGSRARGEDPEPARKSARRSARDRRWGGVTS